MNPLFHFSLPLSHLVFRLAAVGAVLSPGWGGPALAANTVNADGTVTDTTTGLVWDRCPYGLKGPTCTTGTAVQVDWPAALTTAVTANSASYKGFGDWRLPNRNELESLVNIAAANPAIDTTAFPGTPSGVFWSSTSYAPGPTNAWVVFFTNGDSDAYYTSFTYYVRLVRSGQSLAPFDILAANRSYTSTAFTASGMVTGSFTGGSGASCGYASTQYTSTASVGVAPPAGVTFPHGLFKFKTAYCGNSSAQTFTLTYPQALPAGTQYYKFGPTAGNTTPHWYVLPATITGNQVVFTITDGGLGDDDLTVNGVVVDDGGPGVPGGAGGGAGGAGVTGVPTLSEWGLMLLVGLMGLLGWRQLTRKLARNGWHGR